MEIDKDLSKIEDLLENNLIVKIIGPSGIGKTTNLPKYFGKKYKVVVVVSNPIFLNKLKFPNVTYVSSKEYRKIGDEDILIVDEIDSGSLDNFLIISLWKNSNKNVKLILNSNLSHSLFPDFPTYNVKKYMYHPPEVRYLSDTKNFTESISQLIDLVYKSFNSSIKGDFIIFALRKKSVNNIIEKLRNIVDADIFSSYDIKPEMYKEGNKRKIIVSGSLGKTSITLKNISCVFDLMRERRIVPTLTGGYIDKVEYISQRDSDLRGKKGRIVYRFISEKTFKNLPKATDELLFRIPLHHLMLDMYSQNLDPFKMLFNFPREQLNFMYKMFLKYKLLDIAKKVTQKGKLVRKLTFGIRPSILVVENKTYNSLKSASLIDKYFESPFIFNTTNHNTDYLEHVKIFFSRFRGDSDLETLFLIWESANSEEKDLEKWCLENHIKYEYIKNVKWGIDKAKKVLELNEGFLDVNTMKELYEDRKLKLDLDRTIFAQYYDNEGIPYKPDVLSINTLEQKRPIEVYGIIKSNVYNTDLNSLMLSYVAPYAVEQKQEEGKILF